MRVGRNIPFSNHFPAHHLTSSSAFFTIMKGQISLKQKLSIRKYLREHGNVTARNFSNTTLIIQPSQIRSWRAGDKYCKEKKMISVQRKKCIKVDRPCQKLLKSKSVTGS